MLTPNDRLKRAVKRILDGFTRQDAPELLNFVSGSNDTSGLGAIDDGDYGDPLRDTRPDFVKRDNAGWE